LANFRCFSAAIDSVGVSLIGSADLEGLNGRIGFGLLLAEFVPLFSIELLDRLFRFAANEANAVAAPRNVKYNGI